MQPFFHLFAMFFFLDQTKIQVFFFKIYFMPRNTMIDQPVPKSHMSYDTIKITWPVLPIMGQAIMDAVLSVLSITLPLGIQCCHLAIATLGAQLAPIPSNSSN